MSNDSTDENVKLIFRQVNSASEEGFYRRHPLISICLVLSILVWLLVSFDTALGRKIARFSWV